MSVIARVRNSGVSARRELTVPASLIKNGLRICNCFVKQKVPAKTSRSHSDFFLVASSTPGVVQVYLVNYLRETISSTVPFTYIDPNNTKEDFVEQDIKNMNDLQEMLMLLSSKMGKMNLNSNESKETNLPGKQ